MKIGELIRFYPSPEYLEAGKFKLLRDILKEKGSSDYAAYYLKKHNGGCEEGSAAEGVIPKVLMLNFGALAMVSGVKAEQAKQYITDLF